MFGLTTKNYKMQKSSINNENPAIGNVLLAVRASLPNNCTRSEALKHYGFTEVGRKSIRGNSYSKCWFHEKLNIFAVPFMWRTSYHKFMSRDEKIQNEIDKYTSEMWYGIDVIRYFKSLSERLS
jgi:hypothetical protein